MSLKEYDFKKIGIFLALLLILSGGIIGGISGYYYYNKFRASEKLLIEASQTGQTDVRSLIAKVGKLIKLPEDEEPTIAKVTDLNRLSNQPFFAKAKVGDRVLLYMQAKKAFLYDPVNNLIVEVGPLLIPTPTGTGSEEVAGFSIESTPSAQVTQPAF